MKSNVHIRLYLDDDGEWKLMPDPEPATMWHIDSSIRWLDNFGASTCHHASELVSEIENLLVRHGYQKENLRFDDYTDQIHGWIKYADGKWRRLINIVYC